MVYPDGTSTYLGSFNHNVFSGSGKLTLKSENGGKHVYTGGFRDGKLEVRGSSNMV